MSHRWKQNYKKKKQQWKTTGFTVYYKKITLVRKQNRKDGIWGKKGLKNSLVSC